MADQFELQGPDADGNVWICSPEGSDVWCHNLGPVADVAEALSQFLGSIDYEETEASRLVPVNRRVIGPKGAETD